MMNPVLSSSYFPPTSWFTIAQSSGNITIDIHEHYTKQTWRNRCRIAGANGPLDLIIPVKTSGNHTPMKDVRVDYATNWQRVHWHAIRSAYGKSPFFEFYADRFDALYATEPRFLIEWNESCLHIIIKAAKLNFTFTLSEEYCKLPANHPDFRLLIAPSAANAVSNITTQKYMQVFEDRFGFQPGLSVLDLLFCAGPESAKYLHGGE